MLTRPNNYRSISALALKPLQISSTRPLISRRYNSTETEDVVNEHSLHGKTNTILNICPQQKRMVVERFGSFNKVVDSGLFLAIPIVDRIRYVIDMKEIAVPISPQSAITKDNVSVELGGNVYIQFVDAKKAAYGAEHPVYAVTQHAQSAMRAIVGETTLDELFHNRDRINVYILNALLKAIEPWGLTVHRYEVTTVTTEPEIHHAMNKQASAERQRREDILHAEAVKRTLELESEGQKQKLINESEGNKIEQINRAEGNAVAVKLAADAEYYRTIKDAEGRSEALETIGHQLETEEGYSAGQYDLARLYTQEYGKILGKSNTMILPNNNDDVTSFVTKAMTIYKGIKNE